MNDADDFGVYIIESVQVVPGCFGDAYYSICLSESVALDLFEFIVVGHVVGFINFLMREVVHIYDGFDAEQI